VFTEYKDTYRQFPSYEPVRAIKPDTVKLDAGTFDADTSYKNAYVTHEVKPHPKREQAKYKKPIGKVDGTSSYQYDYTEKFAPKMPSARPPYRPTTADRPFNDTTVHRETYQPWELAMREGIRPPPAIKLPGGKFTHQSTFQEDFQGHKAGGREAIRIPEPALSITPGKFADETTTRRDYTAKGCAPEKSAKPQQNVVRHKGPFDYKTTCQTTYAWRQGRPASSCKPPEMTHRSPEPLDCDTTNNLTYKAWQVPKIQGWKPRNGWVAPTDQFDHKTTFQHDYDGKPAEPAKSARPDYQKAHPGEFDGLTTHASEFKSWGVGPQKSYRPVEAYRNPHKKFDGETTFQTDFKAAQSSRPKLCIPKEGGVMFSGDQNFRTMYKDTYLGSRLPPCPAKTLEMRVGSPSKTGHMYTGDMNGHQYFSVRDDTKKAANLVLHPPAAVKPAANVAVEVVG